MSQSFNQNINSDINEIKKWIVENFSTITNFSEKFQIHSSLFKYFKYEPLTKETLDKINRLIPKHLQIKDYPIAVKKVKFRPKNDEVLQECCRKAREKGDAWIEELRKNNHAKYSEYGYTGDRK